VEGGRRGLLATWPLRIFQVCVLTAATGRDLALPANRVRGERCPAHGRPHRPYKSARTRWATDCGPRPLAAVGARRSSRRRCFMLPDKASGVGGAVRVALDRGAW